MALLMLTALLAACSNKENTQITRIENATRIVSLNGTLTEILCSFGYEKNIVGVDVTSTYPQSILEKPKVGHNRNMSAEGIIALKPDIVLGVQENMKPELAAQLRAAGARVLLFSPEYSVKGAKKMIQAVADSLRYGGKTSDVFAAIDADTREAARLPSKPKVLFIYARGAGTLMASGTNTSIHSIIGLAGGQNAVTAYEDFKPLTTEALVSANPDVILLFDSGLASLGGVDGLLQVPGVSLTNAGKAKRVIEMDGQLLTGFGPRTGTAIAQLSKKLDETIRP